MLLFLDFDGVVHPRAGNLFDLACLSHIERALKQFPIIEVVITSSWREQYTLEELKQLLGKDIAKRVIGQTPLIRGSYEKHVRYNEVKQYLSDTNQLNRPWVALDDAPELYPEDAPVVFVNGKTGMTERESEQLCIALRILSYHYRK